MKILTRLAIATLLTIAIAFGGLVTHAGGWDNFKLRYFFLTKYFNDQNKELDDLRKQNKNSLENARIKLDDLLDGGPGKDGIPSIDNPSFDTAKTTPFKSDETVIGVVVNGEAKAYPFGIMNWHENQIIFPVRNQDSRKLPPKAIVTYVWEADNQKPNNRFSGVSLQFSHQEMAEIGTKLVDFNGRKIRARWDKEFETVIVEELDGKQIPSSTAFAFVYPAFF